MPERSGDDVPLFPMVLPFPKVLRIRIVESKALACQVWSRMLVNTLVAWSNFVVLGCSGGPCEPKVIYRSLEEALFAGRLLVEAEEFATPDLVLGSP